MTTSVTIKAHCSVDQEVRVKLCNNGAVEEYHVMQDGEEREITVYDGREVSVREHTKGQLE